MISKAVGDISLHISRKRQFEPCALPANDAEPGFKIGSIDPADKSGREPRHELWPEPAEVRRRAIRGKHQLSPFARKRVDGVQQLDQCSALAREELHVVDN